MMNLRRSDLPLRAGTSALGGVDPAPERSSKGTASSAREMSQRTEHSSIGSPLGCIIFRARTPPRSESSGTAAYASSVSELCATSLRLGRVDGASHSAGTPLEALRGADDADHTHTRSTDSSGRDASTSASSAAAARGAPPAPARPSSSACATPHSALKPLPSTVEERHTHRCRPLSLATASVSAASPGPSATLRLTAQQKPGPMTCIVTYTSAASVAPEGGSLFVSSRGTLPCHGGGGSATRPSPTFGTWRAESSETRSARPVERGGASR
mmetsp:Transcript_5645/g.16017  ORF Transcript_5645/g.16017 Transcript_5645/m.16017 type:complete len:271 (-) Transcript_5645:1554-2366(-)